LYKEYKKIEVNTEKKTFYERFSILEKKNFSVLNYAEFSNLDKIEEMKIKECIIVKKSTIKAKYSPYKQKAGFYLYFLRIYNKLSYLCRWRK